MVSVFRVFAAAGLAVLCTFTGVALAAAPQGYVHEVRGDVRAAIGSGKPVAVKQGETLVNGTNILTGGDSLAVLRFVDGTVIALNQNTAFTIQKYHYNVKSASLASAFFSMVRGGLRVVTGTVSQRNYEVFRLATPSATIDIRGTEFLAQIVNPLVVSVVTGSVGLSNAAGTFVVGAGQTASVASATSAMTSLSVAPPGTFGSLPNLTLPPAVPGPLPGAGAGGGAAGGSGAAGASGAASAAAGGFTGLGLGGAAAAAAAAAALGGGGGNSPGGATGTTGTTGTQ